MSFARVAVMLAALTALFMGAGYLLGGQTGLLIAFLIAAAMNLFSYWNSDKMVLNSQGARQVDERTAPDFYGIVAQLARNADLPMPKVYIIETPQPNAFATGRNPQNSAVAATTGLLQSLSSEEIAGVMAHELAHVQHRDTLTMTVAATLAGAISMLANMALFMGGNRENGGNPLASILMMILAPLAAAVIQMAISRSGEYRADEGGARISGQPLWLASALQKIETSARRVTNQAAERNPVVAPLYIINPLNGKRWDNLFSTHPSTANRIERLRQLASEVNRGPQPPRRA